MWNRWLIALVLLCAVSGCAVVVPAKIQVTDVGSGRIFTTYSTWGKENMLGYNFYDIDSGDRVMLKGYSTKVIRQGGFYKNSDPEALEYVDDAKRAGIQP